MRRRSIEGQCRVVGCQAVTPFLRNAVFFMDVSLSCQVRGRNGTTVPFYFVGIQANDHGIREWLWSVASYRLATLQVNLKSAGRRIWRWARHKAPVPKRTTFDVRHRERCLTRGESDRRRMKELDSTRLQRRQDSKRLPSCTRVGEQVVALVPFLLSAKEVEGDFCAQRPSMNALFAQTTIRSLFV